MGNTGNGNAQCKKAHALLTALNPVTGTEKEGTEADTRPPERSRNLASVQQEST